MPKVSEMIVSKFLRKEDIEDDTPVTVKGVEDMPGERGDQKWVLYFREFPAKGLVLNTTLIRMLEKTFGPDSDDWAGKKVVLFVDPTVSFKGQVIGGLRLRPIKQPAKPAAASGSPQEGPVAAAPEFDDKI